MTDLLRLNGHYSPTSNIKIKDWNKYINFFIKKYKICNKDNVLEIGCGAGAFLFPLYKKKINCFGADFSRELIRHCKKFLVSKNFYVRDAINLTVFKKRKYSFIFANSLFQYFPTQFYAKKVLDQIFNLTDEKTKIFLLDIPDKKKYNNWKLSVIKKIGQKDFSIKYKNTKHRFYDKNFFFDYCNKNKYKIKISKQNLIKKENSKFRFNVLMYK